VKEAHAWGVRKPEVMTRVELVDEVLRLSTPSPEERRKVRGWLGVARDLLASAVERGLHLPDAAAMIRGDVRFEPLRPPDAPVATVTLAEIYGAQGHFDRALEMLGAVLDKEPEHEAARRLRARIEADRAARRVRGAAPPPSSEPEADPEAAQAVDPPAPAPAPVAAPPAEPGPPPAPSAADPAGDAEPATARRQTQARGDALGPGDSVAALVRTGDTRATVHYAGLGEPGEGERLVLRVLELRVRSAGAERIETRLRLAAPSGTAQVEGLEAGSVVRAAVLREGPTGVVVLAVAGEVSPGPAGDVLFAPRRSVDYSALLRPGPQQVAPA